MKKLIAATLLITLLATLCGCGNKDMFDTVYTYNKAIVKMPDDTSKEIQIKKWRDYEDGEQIQIEDMQGNIYLVNSVNCVLIKD